MKKRLIALLLAICTLFAFTACGDKNEGAVDTEVKKTTSDSYPLDTDVELDWWMQLQNGVTAFASGMNETDFHDYLEEATGVKINFQHPVAGQETAAANILFNSGNLPDIMEYNFATNYSGGLAAAVEDGIVAPLNPYMEAGILPNYKGLLDENPNWGKELALADGTYATFPQFIVEPITQIYVAYMVRQDLLDKAGMQMPVTVDEWDAVLTKFKEMGIEYPLFVNFEKWWMQNLLPFASPFNISFNFYHDDGVVKYGPAEEGFGEWIKLMKKWYDKGILAKDFINIDNKKMTAEIAAGNNGAVLTGLGGQYGEYVAAMGENTDIAYRPTTVPVMNAGDTPYIHQKTQEVGTAICSITSEDNREIAARVLDYGYSEAGYNLYNFGKEGESFNWATDENGEKYQKYTDIVTDMEANGNLALASSLAKHTRAPYGGPYIKSGWYIRQYYPRAEQIDGIEKSDSDAFEHMLPANLSMSLEDRQKVNDIILAVETYVYESFPQLIAGKMSIDKLDDYFAQLEKLGINEAIEIYQKAYDAYLEK